MFSLSLKEIWFFKLRYLLIGFIMFFVAALVFIISGLANGLSSDNASSIQNMNAHAFYLDKDADNRLDRSRFDEKVLSDIKDNKNLQTVGLQMLSLKEVNSDKKVDVSMMGIDPNSFLMPKVTEGSTIKSSKGPTIVADDSLKKQGIEIGDKLYEENSDITYTVVGFTEKQTFSHTPVAFVNKESWENLFASTQKVSYNAIVIKDANKELQEDVSSTIKDGVWVEKGDVIKGIPGYDAEQKSLFMMLAFLIVIAVFVLTAFFYIMTIQKVNQFGVLKAIGAKNNFLIGSTIIQVIILSIVSIGAAIGFAAILQAIMPKGIPFVFDFGLILIYSGILFIVSIFGALLSSASIVKADPLQAMGRAE